MFFREGDLTELSCTEQCSTCGLFYRYYSVYFTRPNKISWERKVCNCGEELISVIRDKLGNRV